MSLDSNIQSVVTAIGLQIKDIKTNTLKTSDVIDTLTSLETNKPLSAKQGKVLKDLIDGINSLLSSNDTSLDQLQEIVTFIKNNKSLLDSLAITNITGLQNALDAKASVDSVSTLSANVGATDTDYVAVLNAAMV
jgi:hypothetical protein